MTDPLILLTAMEAMAGIKIEQKAKKLSRIHIVRQGNLNKMCSSCGHKNKKCTCESIEAKETKE